MDLNAAPQSPPARPLPPGSNAGPPAPDERGHVQSDLNGRAVQTEGQVREVLDRIDEAFITLDLAWRFTYANPSAERLLQRPAGELLGAVLWSLFPESQSASARQSFELALKGQHSITFTDYFPRLGKWFEIRAFALAAGLTVFFRDVTRQKDHDARLEYQASHDAGTGLWNQRSLLRELSLRLLDARRQGGTVGVMVVALCGHRELTAHAGHTVAEKLVWELAQRLRPGMNEDIAVARSSADEFTLILPAATREALALQAQHWLRALQAPIRLGGHRLRPDLAAGTAWQGEDGGDTTALLANAQVALAAALAQGPATVMAFDRGMRERAARRQHLLDAMRHEHFLTQLDLHYQPQFNLKDHSLVGLEALLRWHSPTLGTVSPAEFVPLAESSDLIEDIGRWVSQRVCQQVAQWRSAGLAPPPVAMNASARELLSPGYAPRLLATLQAHRLDCTSVCVEVTESVAVDGFELVRPTLALLAQAGVQIHLDDFGQGYCNLRRLQWLDIHTLKIDRSLIAGMDRDAAARAMLQAIVELARSLGKQVLVEGIETEAERAAACAIGCDMGQGYLFGRPGPASMVVLPALSAA